MIEIVRKDECCGCGGCMQKCPKACITMKTDNEGFWYPSVDINKCIDCGLCEKVCPYKNIGEAKTPKVVYAAKAKDDEILLNSSSGGLFSLMANYIFEHNGVVFGAAFNKDWQVEIEGISDSHELERLRGSKYVQANTNRTFLEVEEYLKAGRIVLYTGTPCQIKALKLYLKDYDRLFTVDIACHGVPSPEVWGNYLKEVCSKGVIKKIKFRDKQAGWHNYHIVITAGTNPPFQEVSSVYYMNSYFNAFNFGLITRPSCTNCPSKHGKSDSDITIADFWGIEKIEPNFDDDKGVSLVLLNTSKGQYLFNKLSLTTRQCDYADAISFNTGLRENAKFHPSRTKFFENFRKKDSITKYMNKLLTPSLIQRILRRVMLIIAK